MAWKASWANRTGENEKKEEILIKFKNRSERRAPVLHNRLEEFEIRPDLTTNFGISCP